MSFRLLPLKTSPCFRIGRTHTPHVVTVAMLLLASVTSAAAQDAAAVATAQPAVQSDAQRQETLNAGMTEAKALAKTKNLKATAARLGTLNVSRLNTAEWHIELAQRLVQLAEQFSREADAERAVDVANLAVAELQDALGLAANDRTKSGVHANLAFLQERFLGDPAGALANYEKAAGLSPRASHAKEAVERLKQAEATRRTQNSDKK